MEVNFSTLCGTFVDYIKGLNDGKMFLITMVKNNIPNSKNLVNVKSRLSRKVKSCYDLGYFDGFTISMDAFFVGYGYADEIQHSGENRCEIEELEETPDYSSSEDNGYGHEETPGYSSSEDNVCGCEEKVESVPIPKSQEKIKADFSNWLRPRIKQGSTKEFKSVEITRQDFSIKDFRLGLYNGRENFIEDKKDKGKNDILHYDEGDLDFYELGYIEGGKISAELRNLGSELSKFYI